MKIKLKSLLIVFILFVGANIILKAGACRNNYWQPTFVHDLDYEDGPWYVMPNGQFSKVRIVDNWDWAPHACDLINHYGVRDYQGYTSCKQYTRIQCGCKRGISEPNSTCSRFLAGHYNRYPTEAYFSNSQHSVNVAGVTFREVTASVNVGHNVQVWEIEKKHSSSGRYKISIKHAVAGQQGSFYIIAWADTNNDGIPDKEIGRSHRMMAQNSGQWSSWEFISNYQRIFVGNTWNQSNERVYYQMGGSLLGYSGLSSRVYYSRYFNGTPNQSTGPRYTNIRVQVY